MMNIATPNTPLRKWALVGHGDAASAVAAAWKSDDLLVQWGGFDAGAPWVDGVILAESRLKAAYDAALGVLARGVTLVVTEPQLLAVHGRILDAAARSSGGRVAAAALTFGEPLQDRWAQEGSQLMACWGGAADRYVQRLTEHGDAPERAERLVRWQGAMEDWDGKTSHAHALALYGLWAGWASKPTVTRVPVSGLTEASVRAVTGAGLRLRFGAVMTHSEVVVGPMVMAEGATLVNHAHTGMMVQHAHGWHSNSTTARPLQQLVAGVWQAVSSPRPSTLRAPMRAAPASIVTAWQDFGGVMLPCVGVEKVLERLRA